MIESGPVPAEPIPVPQPILSILTSLPPGRGGMPGLAWRGVAGPRLPFPPSYPPRLAPHAPTRCPHVRARRAGGQKRAKSVNVNSAAQSPTPGHARPRTTRRRWGRPGRHKQPLLALPAPLRALILRGGDKNSRRGPSRVRVLPGKRTL